MTERTREVKIRPAFDKRARDPKKNYGIHGAEIAFYLKGPEGAVQFVIYTNWQLEHVRKEGEAKHWEPFMWQPMGADVGYHSHKPRYEGQTIMTEECDLIGGGPCYYDGSGLMAGDVLELLIREGDEAMWKKLEERYEEWLCGADEREQSPESDA